MFTPIRERQHYAGNGGSNSMECSNRGKVPFHRQAQSRAQFTTEVSMSTDIADEEVARAAMADGAHRYMGKPFDSLNDRERSRY